MELGFASRGDEAFFFLLCFFPGASKTVGHTTARTDGLESGFVSARARVTGESARRDHDMIPTADADADADVNSVSDGMRKWAGSLHGARLCEQGVPSPSR